MYIILNIDLSPVVIPNICKGNNLFIINGRIGNDKGIGKLTCKNSSVDYVISSVDFLKHIVNVSINEFSKFSNFISKFCILSTSMLFTKSTLYVSSHFFGFSRQASALLLTKFVRQHYRKLKRRCKTNNTEETRELMKKAEKDYKK
jgi:hypothetical protein